MIAPKTREKINEMFEKAGSLVVWTVFGSHLYGTDTPDSDTDVKGIFIANQKDIILKRDAKTLKYNSGDGHSRNSREDVDIEIIELRKFLGDAMSGQTYALDILFSPESVWGESTPIWEEIVGFRDNLISKNVKPFIGYCRNQAGKYGLKGSRLGELKRVIKVLETLDPGSRLEKARIPLRTSEFVFWKNLEQPGGNEVPHLNVIGKWYSESMKIRNVLDSLYKIQEKYGHRAEKAMENEGVDWKAVSHAYRCMYELEALLRHGEIKFPLPQAKKLKEIKAGKIPYSIIQDELPELMDDVTSIESSLPKKPNRKFVESWIVDTYSRVWKDGNLKGRSAGGS